MATYKHGVYTSEQATSMTAPVTGTAGLQVVVGTAPDGLADIAGQAVLTGSTAAGGGHRDEQRPTGSAGAVQRGRVGLGDLLGHEQHGDVGLLGCHFQRVAQVGLAAGDGALNTRKAQTVHGVGVVADEKEPHGVTPAWTGS